MIILSLFLGALRSSSLAGGSNPFGKSTGKYNDNYGGGGKGGKYDNYGGGGGKGSKGKDGGKGSNPFSTSIPNIGHPHCQTLKRISIPLGDKHKHWGSVDALAMHDGRVLSGSRDKSRIFVCN